MKKYTSRTTKWFALAAIISLMVLLVGIVLIVVKISDLSIQVGLIMFGGSMSILFLICFFAGKSRWLTIDADKIVLPRGAIYNGKNYFKRAVIRIDEITCVESEFHKGDKFQIFMEDFFFYTLKLKDGTKIKFTLFEYGKAEKEIIETIKKYIR